MSDDQHIELFERYLNGELSPAEHSEFEQRLLNDKSFADAFAEHQDAIEGIKLAGRKSLKAEFAALQKGIPDDDLQEYKPSRGGGGKTWPIMYWVMIFGSVVLAIAFIIGLTRLPKVEELRERAERNLVVERGEVEPLICVEKTIYPANDELLRVLATARGNFGEASRNTGYTLEDLKLTAQASDSMDITISDEAITQASRTMQFCEEHNKYFEFHYRSTALQDSVVFYGVDAESTKAYHISYLNKSYLVDIGYTNPDKFLFVKYEGQWFELNTDNQKATPLIPIEPMGEVDSTSIIEGDTVVVGGHRKLDGDKRLIENNTDHIAEDEYENYTEKVSADEYKPADVDRQPLFKGGHDGLTQFLSENIKYPERARENGITGVVRVKFIVDADGQVGNLSTESKVDQILIDEAFRVVRMLPRFKPAEKDNKTVAAPMMLPINFTLE